MFATAMDLPEAYRKADYGPDLQTFVIVMIIVTVFSIFLLLVGLVRTYGVVW
jgi:hypothetical protein